MSPTPITRETFIDPSHLKTVLTQDTMYVLRDDEEGVEEVPIPESFKKVGIPEGYSVDFVLDPATLVRSLAKQGIVTEDQLEKGLLKDLKDTINASDNLKIIPTSVYESKREAQDEALENSDEEDDDDEGEEEEPTGPPITRATFISPTHIATALSQKTMYKLADGGEGVKEVPITKSVKKAGVIPQGYSVDFIVDPATIVKSLAKQGLVTEGQLSEELLNDLKEPINSSDNLKIVPTSVYEAKLAALEASLENDDDDDDEEEEE
ncbi:hypothetical protein K443DRAFT_678236 [Laccaria amethystina LaAM-08-1]|uniref:Uncharacterized protein n=1 Tax=Laccaria amethystina LaAM-08-1 TaxID=1095629 RepID=A0A0C9XJM4_9AGAR|nr:hypothetical protein K443DRAFT_678236 [Laccaria amethystina LaAM-08-1]